MFGTTVSFKKSAKAQVHCIKQPILVWVFALSFFVRLFGMLGGQLIQIEYDRNILIMIPDYYVRKNQT